MEATYAGLGGAFEKEQFIKYCNGEANINKELLVKEIEDALYKINMTLVNLEFIERIHISYDIKEYGDKISGISFTFVFKQISNGIERYTYTVKDINFEKFKIEFKNILRLIIDGSEAISELNKEIREIQKAEGASLVISYRWGIVDNFCKVVDWDYDIVKVKLSRNAVNTLIELQQEGSLKDIIHSQNWNISIKKFIENFNQLELHCKIGAVLEVLDVETVLKMNMLSVDDVIAVVRRNKHSKGVQSFKSISIMKELGTFAVVCKWYVDYANKKINMRFMHDKVLDLESGRFVSDRDLCDRLEQRINIPDNVKEIIFT